MQTLFGSKEALLNELRTLELLSFEDAQRLDLANVQGDHIASCVKRLVASGLLTDFQLRQILAGKGRKLHFGPYLLQDHLGRGGMGRVFRAEHRLMKRIVALKIVGRGRTDRSSRTRIERFRREIEAVSRLRHPNIVQAYDAGIVRGRPYLAMEYLKGIDLHHLIKKKGPLPIDLACEALRQTAEALHHAHGLGLVHRDLKPSNLMLVTPGLTIKLLDLGLARWREDSIASGEELDEELCGTPDFMPPEWGQDHRRVDVRADLYSLGCTFYYLLSGKLPHPGGTWTEKMWRHSFDAPASLTDLRPEIPTWLAQIIHRLMARNVEDRYTSAAEVARHVSDRRVLDCTDARAESLPARRRATRRVVRLVLAMFAFILLGGAAGSGARHIMRSTKEQKTSAQSSFFGFPFVIEGRSTSFRSLREAITAAADGDIITIHADGPMHLDPIACRGKSIKVRSADAIRPQLRMKATDDPWQALLQTDRDLTLEGLDLGFTNEAPRASRTASPPLIISWQASLHLINCRCQGGAGGTAIIARKPRILSLKGCEIETGSVGISVEVGKERACRIDMSASRMIIQEGSGAALSLWSADGDDSAAIDLSLQNDTVQAGRILAVRSLAKKLAIEARDNHFIYRTALLSLTDCASRDAWRDVQWSGDANRYQGAASWLWCDGHPVTLTPQPTTPDTVQKTD